MEPDQRQYFKRQRETLEKAIQSAVQRAVCEQCSDPITAVGKFLLGLPNDSSCGAGSSASASALACVPCPPTGGGNDGSEPPGKRAAGKKPAAEPSLPPPSRRTSVLSPSRRASAGSARTPC